MDPVRPRLFLVLVLVASAGVGCSRGDSKVAFDRRSGSSTTSEATTTSAAAPTTTAAAKVTVRPAPAQAASATCPAVPARTQPRPDRSAYTVHVDVRPDENAVVGDLAVRFTPDQATDHLVLRLWANSPRIAGAGGKLTVGKVLVGGAEAATNLDNATTLSVRTGRSFAAGTPVDVSLDWRLVLPGTVNDRVSRTGDAIRLGSFFPVLAWEPGVGWATEPPSSGFSEAAMTPHADFAVHITVPAGVDVLATGVRDDRGWWNATAVPDFALSTGHFTLASATVNAPNPVNVTVGVQQGINESPKPYLDKAVRVLQDFSGRFGPYAWPTYTLAITPGVSGGIEFPMHVMQGPGKLGRTTSHEIGHEWFYGLVHDDQGRDPWIDEGLASYAESRFEHSEASFRSRSIPPVAVGHLGEPMTYWEPRQSSYYRGVYVQGAQALMALGPLDRVDCALRHYVARMAYRVARPADVLAALSVVFQDAPAIFARYGVHG
ncbi:MAG: hypothetical protein QOE35_384 [Actinomycetota bacterium]|jgi:hypothetical protein